MARSTRASLFFTDKRYTIFCAIETPACASLSLFPVIPQLNSRTSLVCLVAATEVVRSIYSKRNGGLFVTAENRRVFRRGYRSWQISTRSGRQDFQFSSREVRYSGHPSLPASAADSIILMILRREFQARKKRDRLFLPLLSPRAAAVLKFYVRYTSSALLPSSGDAPLARRDL